MAKKRRIALSASYFNVPQVADLLVTCDVIYTTNWERLSDLKETFGSHRINLKPHGLPAFDHWVVEQEDHGYGVEVITFSDIKAAFRRGIAEANDALLIEYARHFGWQANPVSLYDEEGVEGTLWTKYDMEYTSLDGEVPPEVRDDMVSLA